MSKVGVITLVCVLALTASNAASQNLCPSGSQSDKLICLLPQVYGPDGLVLTNSGTQFQTNFLTGNLRPLNSALARQSALLPVASPSSGLIFSNWDPVTRVFSSTTDSLGPIFGERAQTIGARRVFVGFGYQYFNFGTLDGVDLSHLPVVFTQPDVTINFGPSIGTKTCSLSSESASTGFCSVIRDVIKTDNRVDLKIHEWTTALTFGVTDWLDVSAVIPIENVRMGIGSNATIVNNSNTPAHSFKVVTGVCDFPCRAQVFSNVRTASGIGDMIVRAKAVAWRGEKAALALGGDVRFPTGDALNYIGSGAYGVKPFAAWSYLSRFSPHFLAGYEVNGSSRIAGDITTGSKERLPDLLTYSGGLDVWITDRLTAAADLVGQQVFEGRRTSITTLTEPGACTQDFGACAPPFKDHPTPDFDLAQSTGTFNVTNVSVGMKLRPFGDKKQVEQNRPFSSFLITGNVLIKANEGGLRAQAIPLLGISYTF